MNFSTPKFETAVTQFKALFPGHEQLFRYGQFYVNNRMIADLIAQIEAELRSNIRFQFLPDQLNNAITFFATKLREWPTPVTQIMQMLDLIEVGGDMASIRAMLGHSPQDAADVQTSFASVWSTPDIPAAPLWFGQTTLGKADAAFQLEKTKCFEVLRALARKLLKARGITTLPGAVRISEGAAAGASVQGPAAGAGTEVPQQTIRHANPAALPGLMQRMKATIDAGGYVQCGLLSGVSHEHSAFPNPEHYVMVFAYDVIDGLDAFLFWDPDAARSNIATTSWGRGFGVLFGSGVRLSTAANDADLVGIVRTRTLTTFGDHIGDPVRHCYQVYYLQSLPL